MIKTHGVSGNTLTVSVYDHTWTDGSCWRMCIATRTVFSNKGVWLILKMWTQTNSLDINVYVSSSNS